MQEEMLVQYLKRVCAGKKHSTQSRSVEQALHLSGNELRKKIHRLRCKGVPIASNRDGYYYALTAGEIYDTIRQLEKMRTGINAAIRGLETAMERFGEQDGGSL